ncbi:MAG: ATP-dependent metallopeptidase FtsH/Yme1/Tma family protein, partial [Methylosarcina sp.]
MKTNLFTILLWVAVISGSLLIFNRLNTTPPVQDPIAYSEFLTMVKTKQIARVEIMDKHIKLRTNEGQEYETINPDDPHLIDDLVNAGVQIRTLEPPKQSLLMQIFVS